MNEKQAIGILVQVAKLAQSKGILSLDDAHTVATAVSTLTPKEQETEVNQTEKENGEA